MLLFGLLCTLRSRIPVDVDSVFSLFLAVCLIFHP